MTGAPAIGRLIAAVVTVAVGVPWLTSFLGLGLAAGALAYAAGNLGINTDTANMISDSLEWRQDFNAYRDGFPARDRNVVAVVDGPNAEISQAYARDLAASLAEQPELFPTVFYPAGDAFFERNGLLFLPVDELEALADRLIAAQPLLGRLAGNPTGAGVIGLLAESVDRADAFPAQMAGDIERIFADLAATLEAARAGQRRSLTWGELIGVGADNNGRQLVLIKPTVDFVNRARPARVAIERIDEIAAELAQRYGDSVTLRLTGPLVMEHEEMTSITQSATTAGILALIMVVAVLLWALRSFALLLIAVVVLFAGLSMTAAFAALTVGYLNLLSVAFAVLYIGLGVDFILHLSLRLKELMAAGMELSGALVETARGVGASLVICAVTTAAGFFAFVPTEFDGVSQLGLIAGGGMIISLVVSLTLLPALLRLGWRGAPSRVDRPRVRSGPGQIRRIPDRATIGIALVAGLGSLLLLPGLEFNGNPIHLRDPDAESIQTLNDLAADSEAPIFSLSVIVADAAAAEATAVALGELDAVADVQTIDSYVPTDQDDKLFVIEDLDLVLGSSLRRFGPAAADPAALVAALDNLLQVLERQESADDSRGRARDAARRWLAGVGSLGDAATQSAALALDADIVGNLVEQLARLERSLDAEPFGRADLPRDLVDRWVNEAGEELVEVIPRDDLNDNAAAARFVAEVRSIAPRATGLPVVYQEAAATVTRAFILALTYALAIVSLLLIILLRSLRDAVLVLIPIVLAALLTAAGSVLLGLPLNFANIIALPLLVGVGVDSGIHMVHRMRTEPPVDGDPLHTSTSRAVFMSALTTVASFGNLAFSTHLGMASMGQLLTLGMLMSVVVVLGVLPALLRRFAW